MGARKITANDIQFLSVSDCASKTRYHRKTIEKFIRDGKIKSVKINGRRLISVDALRAFLEASLEEGVLEF